MGNYGTGTGIVSESEKKMIVEGFQYRNRNRNQALYPCDSVNVRMCYFLRIM